MIRAEQIVPVIKELVYHIHAEETNDISKMKALLKFDSICLDAMADMLEEKAKNGCNIFILRNFIYYHSVYARAYNFLFDSLKLFEVTSDEKAAVLKMISEVDDIDDANDIMDMINSLTAKIESKTNAPVLTLVKNEEETEDREPEKPSTESNAESVTTTKNSDVISEAKEEAKVPKIEKKAPVAKVKAEKVAEESKQETPGGLPTENIHSNDVKSDKGVNRGKGRLANKQK